MTKSILSFLLVLVLSGVATAQSNNYRMFEWDLLRLGYAIPGGERFGGGVAFGTEVRYNASDRISVGLRPEVAAYTSNLEAETIDVGAAGSFVVTGDYYLRTEGGFRPFGGMGLGSFGGASVTVEDTDDTVDEEDLEVGRSLGIVPRVGMEIGHFRVSLEYNLTFSDQVSNYFGIMIAPTLFGGPK
ncbi:OmpW family outer membrane protein [Lewinella sp. IMCC34191]|uniref:OmpW family outer membrane protein n=1 Tax=Lewinella sp. IMCC34191 TaxID=2259172 RepID=UPI000E24D6F5|nr:OmpW family outer membrane protein [Lewinella sp. IMCC34191]